MERVGKEAQEGRQVKGTWGGEATWLWVPHLHLLCSSSPQAPAQGGDSDTGLGDRPPSSLYPCTFPSSSTWRMEGEAFRG